jgi:hypothetical protein
MSTEDRLQLEKQRLGVGGREVAKQQARPHLGGPRAECARLAKILLMERNRLKERVQNPNKRQDLNCPATVTHSIIKINVRTNP